MKKVHNFTAEQSLTSPRSNYNGMASAALATPGVEGQFDIGCMLKCLGTTALGCAYCLTNPVCWGVCAGPGAVSCLNKCL
ncbi:hypothetical protein [Okeania sp. SIO2B3]|uniref:hypothetical protein n=1 Tax=Okeania sp. SIO2B3 TaxID=2607784 RepID=UPI0013C175F0|nr:hypothetical protein [Okeania sp. SIO2B3]NET46282.1 hypothetical protein [Okeania sp. SIO2B3]